jgi:hypothetical protein
MKGRPKTEEEYRAIASRFAELGAEIQEEGTPYHSVLTCMLGAVIGGFQEAGFADGEIPDAIASSARALINGPPS